MAVVMTLLPTCPPLQAQPSGGGLQHRPRRTPPGPDAHRGAVLRAGAGGGAAALGGRDGRGCVRCVCAWMRMLPACAPHYWFRLTD